MARSYRGVGVIRWLAQDGKDGVNYLIMGWWSESVHYKLSEAGIPVVKVRDDSPDTFSVYKLIAPQSTLGVFIASEWEKVKSADFVYMQEAYIEHLQALTVTAKKLRTSESGARTEIDYRGIHIFNSFDIMNIRFGLKDGFAVMQYFDNAGNLLYDLGPNGITKMEIREQKWTPIKLIYVANSFQNALSYPANEIYKSSRYMQETTYYIFTSKIVGGVNSDPEDDGKIYDAPYKSSGYIPPGIYTNKTTGIEMQQMTTNTRDQLTNLPSMHPNNEPVFDISPLYFKELTFYSFGKPGSYYYAYWNGSLIPI